MEILVLGGGGREHALAWRLARDAGVRSVQVAPGNAGTLAVGERVELDTTDPMAVARHAADAEVDLVVVGPEAPLAAGVVDELAAARVPAFGPTRAAARLESSKAFAKRQMQRAGVATADAESFTDPDTAVEHIRRRRDVPVVKADWLAAGKGVVVPETAAEAEDAVRAMFAGVAPGARIVLERRLHGREVSAFALVSDETVVPLAAACDYKRLRDGDEGPNTGGMGAYAPVPWFGAAELERTAADVFEPIAWRMARDGVPYRGVLYAGLMLTDDGPVVLEFNARFGDPEAQVLLPLVEGDLGEALLGCALGDRARIEDAVRLGTGAAVGVVIAAPGYPESPEPDGVLDGAEPAAPADGGDVLVFHAGTRRDAEGRDRAAGGRVATVVGRGASLPAARDAAYRRVATVTLDGGVHRTDIALREVGTAADTPTEPARA